jgi:hypothetical protein
MKALLVHLNFCYTASVYQYNVLILGILVECHYQVNHISDEQVPDDQMILILIYLPIISMCQKSVSKIYFLVCHHRCVIELIRDVIHLIMTLY